MAIAPEPVWHELSSRARPHESPSAVDVVLAYLDGGQLAGDTLPALAHQHGIPLARLCEALAAVADVGNDFPPSVPERWR